MIFINWELETIKILLSFVGGVIASLLGGYDPLVHFLLLLIVFDIVSGFMRVFVLGGKLNANVMFVGGIKKIAILLVVVVSVQVDIALSNSAPIREIVIMYYMVQEFISFSQNISSFMSLPKAFTDIFDKKEEI